MIYTEGTPRTVQYSLYLPLNISKVTLRPGSKYQSFSKFALTKMPSVALQTFILFKSIRLDLNLRLYALRALFTFSEGKGSKPQGD